MHHGLGALREDRLEQLEELNLSLDDLGGLHGDVSGAEDVTLENLIFIQVANFQLDVVAGARIHHRLLLVVDKTEDLAGEVVGGESQFVAKADRALLDLSKDD